MPDLTERLAKLEQRIRELEDRQALYQLMSSYGPLVDSGDAAATSELWTEDGSYDWGGLPPAGDGPARQEGIAGGARGRQQIADMVLGPQHQSIIQGGGAHVVGLPHIVLDGDRAVATGYTRLYRYDGNRFVVARVSANRWEFVRTSEGWRVARRINRPIDGSEEPRQLLRAGIPD